MLQSGAAPVPFITMMRPGGFKGSASFSTTDTWCIHRTAVLGQQLFSQVNILLVTTANRGYLEEKVLKAQQEYNTFQNILWLRFASGGYISWEGNYFSLSLKSLFELQGVPPLYSPCIFICTFNLTKNFHNFIKRWWKLIPHSAYHCIKWLWPPERSAFYKDLWSFFLLWAQFPP